MQKNKTSRSFGSIMYRLFEPLRSSIEMRWVYIRAIIFPLMFGIGTILGIEWLRQIIDGIQSGLSIELYKYFWYYIVLTSVLLITKIITKNYGYSEIRAKHQKYLFKQYIAQYLTLENTKTEMLGTGRLINIIENGVFKSISLTGELAIKGAETLSRIVFGTVLVFNISAMYGGVYVLVSILIVGLYIYTQLHANISRKARKGLQIEMSRNFVRMIMSKFEILQSNKVSQELNKYDPWIQKRYGYNKQVETWRLIGEGFSLIAIDGLRIVSVGIVLYGLFDGVLSVGDFVSVMIMLGILEQTSFRISRMYIDGSKYYVDVEKSRDLFDHTPIMTGYHEGDTFAYSAGDIQLKNITFSYGDDDEKKRVVFQDFDIHIQGGKKTALVGASGSGKSTLVKLIAGYIRPDSGGIYVDSQRLPVGEENNRTDDGMPRPSQQYTSISLKSYFPHIGYLTQEPSVFDGTIMENLVYGLGASSDKDINMNILKQAIVDSNCEFVYDLPNGLDTEIGERGVRLSGGQKQRLAIAKIFMKNPEIIILDEPTSALDSFSEESITQAMHKLFENRTVIIIAHRLQTVKQADDIILLEADDTGASQIVERGTHDELVSLGGQYAKMLELQSGF